MAKDKSNAKKTIRKQIEQQLFATFDHLKDNANPKKLKRSIRRASKILSAGVKPESPKNKTEEKKSTKKISTKTVAAEPVANL